MSVVVKYGCSFPAVIDIDSVSSSVIYTYIHTHIYYIKIVHVYTDKDMNIYRCL